MDDPRRALKFLARAAAWLAPAAAVVTALCILAELPTHAWLCRGLACLWQGQFRWRVLRDVLPSLIVVGALAWMASDFAQAVYGLRTRTDGLDFVQRRLFGLMSRKPYMLIKEGRHTASEKSPLLRTGGPGNLIVYNDSAVVLEKAGKLTRVVKKGFTELTDFEKVWDVLDLRPQRWVYNVEALTRDGIPVQCQADVTFQIDDTGQPPGKNELYPASDDAIFAAATHKWIRKTGQDSQVLDWAGRAVVGVTEGALRNILATYLLDHLIGPDESTQSHRRDAIQKELHNQVRQALPSFGVKLVKIELGKIALRDEIASQRIKAWQALWKRWSMERQAEGEAERLLYVEAAKAQAQADMIVAITQTFQTLNATGAMAPSQLILLRMFEVLKRASFDPQTGMLFLPTEVMKAWQLAQRIALGQPEAELKEDEK